MNGKIKDVTKIIVRGDMLLCEVFEKKNLSGLILPEANKSLNIDKMTIVAKGKDILDVEVGDIVLHADGKLSTFDVEGRSFTNIPRYICTMIVKPDNYEEEKES